MQEGQRDGTLDAAKAILAYLVILGHCILHGNIDGEGVVDESSILLHSIYAFHMPLFMMISGYLTEGSIRAHGMRIIKKRRKLLKPLFAFAAASCMGSVAVSLASGGFMRGKEGLEGIFPGFASVVSLFAEKFFMNYWFLWAVFYLTVIMALIHRFFYRKRAIAYAVLLLACLFTPDGFNLANYKFMLPFMIVGYEARNLERQNSKWAALLWDRRSFLVSVPLSVLCVACYQSKHLIHETGVNLFSGGGQFAVDAYRVLCGLTVSYSVLFLIRFLYQKGRGEGIWRFLAAVGTYSMELYMVHGYLIQYLLTPIAMKLGIRYVFYSAAAESVAVLLLSGAAIWALKKLRIYPLIWG